MVGDPTPNYLGLVSVTRGRSEMASQELPKLLARVRFPSPAPVFGIKDSLQVGARWRSVLELVDV